jgi:hypothetical protein
LLLPFENKGVMQQVVLFASSPKSLNLDEFFVEQKRMQGIKNL